MSDPLHPRSRFGYNTAVDDVRSNPVVVIRSYQCEQHQSRYHFTALATKQNVFLDAMTNGVRHQNIAVIKLLKRRSAATCSCLTFAFIFL
jgi:hypothetical protein